MKKLALAIAAVGMFGASAQAATLTKTSYTTARKAALAGAAYAFNKAGDFGVYNTRNVRITKALDSRGPSQKYLVKSTNGVRSKVVTVKRESARKFRAFVPNRKVPTNYGNYR